MHVAAGGDLVLGGDRVLDVEDDDVGAGVGGRRESLVLRAVDQQPTPGEYGVYPRSDVRVVMGGADLVVHPNIVAHRDAKSNSGVCPGQASEAPNKRLSAAQCRSAAALS